VYALFTTATYDVLISRFTRPACSLRPSRRWRRGRGASAARRAAGTTGRRHEGGQGVVGAGAGGADGALGVGVAVDAKSVGHETEQQQDGNVFRHREALVDGQRNAEGHGIGRGQDGGAWGCDVVGNFS